MIELTELVQQVRTIAASRDRHDLTARLDSTVQRVTEPGVRVLVVGEFKQGKSLLINALINAWVCPVDDDVATAVPTIVSHAPEAAATLVYAGPEVVAVEDVARGLQRRAVPLDELKHHVTETGNPGNERRLVCAEVGIPRGLLEPGLILIDTPGVGGMGPAHAASTLAELPMADAVLMVSDAAQEYSAPEIEFLRQAMKLCPNVACVLTKTDLHQQWQRVAELDSAHLARAGVTAPLFPLSSTLRIRALAAGDRELNEESGFPRLVDYLRHHVLGNAQQLAQRSVAQDVRHVVEHLALSLQGELGVLRDPARDQELITRLEEARARSKALKHSTARWQTGLNDGMTDLHSDIEYDVRDRTRLIVREADELIDSADPAQVVEQFDEWFEQRIAEAVGANFVWLHERTEWLAEKVADYFAEVSVGIPELHWTDASQVLEPVPPMVGIAEDHTSFPGKVIIGMRGSYGGVLMFGLLTGLIGLALINPLSVGAGLVLGKRAYNEDRAAKLSRRRQDKKATIRRHIDDVNLHVIKQGKDRLRQAQRLLRDHFLDIAGEVVRSLDDAIKAASAAVKTGADDRERRINEISTALQRLQDIEQRANALSATAAPTGIATASQSTA